jgi:hypothetical protein
MGVRVTRRRARVGRDVATRSAAADLLRRHKALVALLGAGALLRVVALVAVYPGIWFSDSNGHIQVAATGMLSPLRVSGYSLVVAPFYQLGSAGALIITQHVLGLGLAVLVYALLCRRGVPKVLAVLGVAPLVLDAYLIDIEHTIMSETVFHAALLGSICLLLWTDRPGLGPAAAAGLLLGYAGITRSVAMPLIAIFVVYLLVRRAGWKPIVLLCLGWAVVVGAYGSIYKAQHGQFGFTSYGGRFLYSKVAPFADCSRLHGLPVDERRYCPDPRHRFTQNVYLWGPKSPIHHEPLGADARIRDFAKRVIKAQPRTYAHVVISGFLHYFEPGHRIGPGDYSDAPWHFPSDPRKPERYPGYRGPIRPGSANRTVSILPDQYVSRMVDRPHTNVTASRALHVYQRFFFTSGDLLAICLIIVLASLVARRGEFRLRLDAALLAVSALTALAVSTAVSVFSYRYALTAVVLLPPAAALAGAALAGRPRVRPA